MSNLNEIKVVKKTARDVPLVGEGGKKVSHRVIYMFPCTMGQKRKKYRINSHLINHCPPSKGVSEVSKRANK